MTLDFFTLRFPIQADIFDYRLHGDVVLVVMGKDGHGLAVERDVLNFVHDGFLVWFRNTRNGRSGGSKTY